MCFSEKKKIPYESSWLRIKYTSLFHAAAVGKKILGITLIPCFPPEWQMPEMFRSYDTRKQKFNYIGLQK